MFFCSSKGHYPEGFVLEEVVWGQFQDTLSVGCVWVIVLEQNSWHSQNNEKETDKFNTKAQL